MADTETATALRYKCSLLPQHRKSDTLKCWLKASLADWTFVLRLKNPSFKGPVSPVPVFSRIGAPRTYIWMHLREWQHCVRGARDETGLEYSGFHFTALPFFFVLWGNLDLRKSAISLSSSFSLLKQERPSRKHHRMQKSAALGMRSANLLVFYSVHRAATGRAGLASAWITSQYLFFVFFVSSCSLINTNLNFLKMYQADNNLTIFHGYKPWQST